MFVFRCLTSNQPEYPSKRFVPLIYQKQLQSSDTNQPYVPLIKNKNDLRTFSVAGPTRWNSIYVARRRTTSIITSRKCIQTYVFDLAKVALKPLHCILFIIFQIY